MNAAPVANFRLDAALAYVMRGWRVIPLHWPKIRATGKPTCSCGRADCGRSIGKHPLTATGFYEGSADPEQIRAWWSKWPIANVGIVTGRASGIVVLDVDTKDDGPNSLLAIEDGNEKIPTTVEAITGSGGSHRFFKHPIHTDVPISASRIGRGIDVRGDGGLVVASPSLHASGERYSWDICAGPDEADLAEIPKWLLKLMLPPPKAERQASVITPGEAARRWLGDALARATPGNRSEQGQRLACQLRDNGVQRPEAEALMRDYASRVPAGDHAYTEREALATYASVMKTPARDPAKSQTRKQDDPFAPTPIPQPTPGAAADLEKYMTGVIEGRIFNVPFPWNEITRATQALQPGSFCLLGGDPGVGKTFFILQCLQHWHGNGINPAIFFAEKDRTFYMKRLLAQLAGNGNLVNLEWIKNNAMAAQNATASHREHLNDLGQHIWERPKGKLTLDFVLGWIRDRAKAGNRVIVVDPITAIDPGAERWSKESDFVQATQELMNEFGVSIVLTTHPKQASGKAGGTTSGHDAAGGAAYFRFVDTMIWMTMAKQPRRVEANHPIGGTCFVKTKNFIRLLKTRDSYGAGWELAYTFLSNLTFIENGVVIKDVKGAEPVDVFGAPSPMTLAMQDLDLDEDAA